ncbi:hypothetical protein ACHHYP_20726 [Achlya hypogyna]|uniref:Uncharacterized protein n=1 Tax=Achlya hypogyna TaxID=1202772 RepID=A0A1V9YD99_ACHHY|nr:hypothetical protein ACHHYP_20726 [Achlya hypogyna]
MVHYAIAGRVDSQELTVCERLLDMLTMSLPDFTVEKDFCLPANWKDRSAALSQNMGFSLPNKGTTKPLVIWTNGRLVATSAEDFTRFVLMHYGIRIDLTAEQVANYTVANHDLLLAQEKELVRD